MKPPPLLKEKELVAWFLITDIAKRFFTSVDKHMRALGLTRAQWYLLTHVYYFEGLTQQELADRMDLTKSSAAKLIRKLEQKKWVRREDDEKDGRMQRVFLIEELRPLVRSLAQVAHAALEPPLSFFNKVDMSQLMTLLRRIESGLDAQPDRPSSGLTTALERAEKLFKELRRQRIL